VVRDCIDLYAGRKRDLVRYMLGMAGFYFPLIEPILKKNGIPEDFIYLAAIESYLNPRAVSPAKAAGPAGRGVTSGRDGVKREASRQQRDFECKMDQDRGGSIAERSSRYRRDERSLVTER